MRPTGMLPPQKPLRRTASCRAALQYLVSGQGGKKVLFPTDLTMIENDFVQKISAGGR
jgi:hypothetical protein